MREMVSGGTVVVPGGTLFYEQTGRGMPLVLISGGSMLDHRGWDDQFAELSRWHRVVRYDLRGLGRSSQPTEPFSPYDDLQSLLDHLGIDRAILVGHSFAGGLAIEFCLERPQRVIAVVAETPALDGFAYSDAFKERVATIFTAYASGGGKATVDAILSDPFLAPKHGRARERLRSIILDNLAIFSIDPALMERIQPPAFDRLEDIHQPVFVISAENDDPDNRAVAKLLEQRVPKARHIELQETGHLAHLDRPQEFNNLVRDFVHGLTSDD
jgi:pimeloyl-ACP methyl ester carboxylesterase